MNDERRGSPSDVPFKPAGPGHFIGRRCDKCGNRASTTGGKVVRVLWHCAGCVAATQVNQRT